MNLLFTYELNGRLQDTNIRTNALHPGDVKTGFGQNNGAVVKLIMKVRQRFQGSVTPEKGAGTIVYLASAANAQGISWKYWVDKKRVSSSEASYNVIMQKRLWQLSEQYLFS